MALRKHLLMCIKFSITKRTPIQPDFKVFDEITTELSQKRIIFSY